MLSRKVRSLRRAEDRDRWGQETVASATAAEESAAAATESDTNATTSATEASESATYASSIDATS